MNNTLKTGITLAVALLFTTGAAFAGDNTRDRKKDRDCKAYSVEIAPGFIVAKDQTQTRDRKKDGSCLSLSVDQERGFILADGKDQIRDQKKDGTCRTS